MFANEYTRGFILGIYGPGNGSPFSFPIAADGTHYSRANLNVRSINASTIGITIPTYTRVTIISYHKFTVTQN